MLAVPRYNLMITIMIRASNEIYGYGIGRTAEKQRDLNNWRHFEHSNNSLDKTYAYMIGLYLLSFY